MTAWENPFHRRHQAAIEFQTYSNPEQKSKSASVAQVWHRIMEQWLHCQPCLTGESVHTPMGTALQEDVLRQKLEELVGYLLTVTGTSSVADPYHSPPGCQARTIISEVTLWNLKP